MFTCPYDIWTFFSRSRRAYLSLSLALLVVVEKIRECTRRDRTIVIDNVFSQRFNRFLNIFYHVLRFTRRGQMRGSHPLAGQPVMGTS